MTAPGGRGDARRNARCGRRASQRAGAAPRVRGIGQRYRERRRHGSGGDRLFRAGRTIVIAATGGRRSVSR